MGENSGPILNRLWTTVHKILKRCRRPIEFAAHLPEAVKIDAISREIVEKSGFWAPIFRGGDTPDFGHAFSNRTHFQPCDRFRLSSVQQARRVADEEKERKKEGRIAVIHKSPTSMSGGLNRIYGGRPESMTIYKSP